MTFAIVTIQSLLLFTTDSCTKCISKAENVEENAKFKWNFSMFG